MPTIGGTQQEAWNFIRELCMRHRGEVQELRGHWEEFDGVPIEMLNSLASGSFIRESWPLAAGERQENQKSALRGCLALRISFWLSAQASLPRSCTSTTRRAGSSSR